VRLAIVGPTFPFKGGVAQHTTAMAHRLRAAGHTVRIETWRQQYPTFLYPGIQKLDEPELPVFEPTSATLDWYRPDGWRRVGRALACSQDAVIFVVVTPLQLLSYEVVARACRRAGVHTVAVCHNVLPHEHKPWDRVLTSRFLGLVDGVVVHSRREQEVARALTSRPIELAALPYFLPPLERVAGREGRKDSLLFLGFVRSYKGLDVLLQALAEAKAKPSLVVAGESWVDDRRLRARVQQLGLEQQVALELRYMPMDEIPDLLAATDALALPYLHGTGSQYPRLAHTFGVPSIVSDTGDLADQVRDGVDGLVCPPGDPAALAAAIDRLYQPGMLERLSMNARPPDPDAEWRDYVAVVVRAANRASGPG